MSKKIEKLLSPTSIGSLRLRNRIAMPPMTMCYANENDGVSQQHINYFKARAAGGAGMIIVGGVTVEGEMGKLFCPSPLLRLDDNKYVAGFNRLVETIHDQGAKAVIQLYNSGRQTTPEKTKGKAPLSASDISTKLMGAIPMMDARAMTVQEIEELEDAYAASALRAKTAGFDAVLIDGGAGYCIAQFMSPYTNKRTDEYGGDLNGRMQFPRNIISKVKAQVGEDYPLFFDLPADELVEGGIHIDESVAIAQMLEKEGILAFRLHVAVYETYQYVVPPAAVPQGAHAHLAEKLKQNLKSAQVMLGHRINDPYLAEDLLQRGAADIILLGRPLIADPEFPNKVAQGRIDDIRRCIACNTGCAARIVNGIPATCTINPAAGKEEEYRLFPAEKPKKVLVVGGGVAGMEAARVAATRNHNVLLYEKSNRLGGQANLAAIPPTKGEIKNHVDWLSRQIEKLRVEVRFGKEMSAQDVIAEKADAVIIATGALPIDPAGYGAEGPVTTAWEVLEGQAKIGENVVIVGGGQVGLETADYLANQGKKVTVLEALPEVGQDMELFSKVFMLPRLASAGITTVTETKVEKIRQNEVVADGKSYECDTVVLAVGQEACSGLTIELEGQLEELYVIGDCDHPRKLLPAIHEGARAGRRI